MRAAAAAWALLAVCAAAALVSLDRGLAADFGGFLNGDRDDVLRDFLTWRGTAIAPPLPMMVVIAILAFLAPRDRRALWGLTALAGAMVVGYLGEPAAWKLDAATTPFVVAGVALAVAVLTMGLRELRQTALEPLTV